jgi:dTDP-4-amino-4,6-dideoxygalactose transaminase
MSRIPLVDLAAQFRCIEAEVLERIRTVLAHGQYILGPEVGELEGKLAEFSGAPHVIGVSSGTDALLMALMALGIGPGDAVFVPAFTFPATAEVVILAGATPVFVDVGAHTFNVSPDDLEVRIERTARSPLRPAAAIAVDLYGLPADYPALRKVCESRGVALVADAAQSFGARLDDRKVGTLAPITTTSFFPAKPLGGYGDGGAVLTLSDETAGVLRSIRNHGQGAERYEIVRLGLNGRLDTLQAAILLAKLALLPAELDARERLAALYDELLGDAVRTPPRIPGARSAWAQYTILVDDRRAVTEALSGAGLPFAIHYPRPLHLQPAYARYGAGIGSLPCSEDLAGRVLSLPMHPYLERANVEEICRTVLK